MKETIITIEEDVKIPGTNVMLEKGDKIQVLVERTNELHSIILNAIEDFESNPADGSRWNMANTVMYRILSNFDVVDRKTGEIYEDPR